MLPIIFTNNQTNLRIYENNWSKKLKIIAYSALKQMIEMIEKFANTSQNTEGPVREKA